MIEDTTEVTLEEEELVEIVRKYFSEAALKQHYKHGSTRGSMYYNEKEGTFRFEFRSKTEGREIPE